MTDRRVEELLKKYEKLHEDNKKYFDREFGDELFKSLFNSFISPELERRKKDSRVSHEYFPKEIMIKIFEAKEPVIEFDDEIKKWRSQLQQKILT